MKSYDGKEQGTYVRTVLGLGGANSPLRDPVSLSWRKRKCQDNWRHEQQKTNTKHMMMYTRCIAGIIQEQNGKKSVNKLLELLQSSRIIIARYAWMREKKRQIAMKRYHSCNTYMYTLNVMVKSQNHTQNQNQSDPLSATSPFTPFAEKGLESY